MATRGGVRAAWLGGLLLGMAGCASHTPAPVSERTPARVASMPPATAKPAPAQQIVPSANGLHTVQRGDTLYAIAFANSLDYREVADWNRLESPDRILVGQVLRLTPRGHDGQFVVDWRIDVDRDCRLEQSTDPFGNVVHSFTVEGPLDTLTITAEGRVETNDTHGIVTGQVERFSPIVFLRDTQLTTADAAIRAFADEAAAPGTEDRIALMHRLMDGIRDRMRFDTNATDTGTSAITLGPDGITAQAPRPSEAAISRNSERNLMMSLQALPARPTTARAAVRAASHPGIP